MAKVIDGKFDAAYVCTSDEYVDTVLNALAEHFESVQPDGTVVTITISEDLPDAE